MGPSISRWLLGAVLMDKESGGSLLSALGSEPVSQYGAYLGLSCHHQCPLNGKYN